jgi:hypothetical protein
MPIIQALECLKSWLGLIEAKVNNPEDNEDIENTGDTGDEVREVEMEGRD